MVKKRKQSEPAEDAGGKSIKDNPTKSVENPTAVVVDVENTGMLEEGKQRPSSSRRRNIDNVDNASTSTAKIKKPVNAFLHYYKEKLENLAVAGGGKRQKKITDVVKQDMGKEWTALPTEEKAPFKEKQEASKAIYAKKKSAATTSKVGTFCCRCSPGKVYKLIENVLRNPTKVSAVNEIGFGWILKLQCTGVRRNLCEYLVNNFCAARSMLTVNGQSITLSPMDVEYILGVKNEGAEVNMKCEGNQVEKLFLKYFKSNARVHLNTLEEQLAASQTGDEAFKIKFVLYVLGIFLCPNSSLILQREFILLVSDVNGIKDINWAKFIFQSLVDSIKKYKGPNKKDTPNKSAGGCLFFLELFYYEHYCLGNDIVPIRVRPRPCLTFWNDVEVKSRQDLLRAKGGFGCSELVLYRDEELPDETEMGNVTRRLTQLEKYVKDQHDEVLKLGINFGNVTQALYEVPKLKEAIVYYFHQKMEKEVRSEVQLAVQQFQGDMRNKNIDVHSQPTTLGGCSTPIGQKNLFGLGSFEHPMEVNSSLPLERGKAKGVAVKTPDKVVDKLLSEIKNSAKKARRMKAHLIDEDDDDEWLLGDFCIGKGPDYGLADLAGGTRPYGCVTKIFGASPSKPAVADVQQDTGLVDVQPPPVVVDVQPPPVVVDVHPPSRVVDGQHSTPFVDTEQTAGDVEVGRNCLMKDLVTPTEEECLTQLDDMGSELPEASKSSPLTKEITAAARPNLKRKEKMITRTTVQRKPAPAVKSPFVAIKDAKIAKIKERSLLEVLQPRRMELRQRQNPSMSTLTSVVSLTLAPMDFDFKKSLCAYITAPKLADGEVIVNMNVSYAERDKMRTMLPKCFVSSAIINLVVLELTELEKDRHGRAKVCYMPPLFAQTILDEHPNSPLNALKKRRMKEYYLSEASDCERLYIPINDDNVHWYLVVLEFQKKKVTILDSCITPASKRGRRTKVDIVLQHTVEFLKGTTLAKVSQDLPKFTVTQPHKDLPSQMSGSNDCGVFVIKYMQTFEVQRDDAFMPDSMKYRSEILVGLVTSARNTERDRILSSAKDWKAPSKKKQV